MKRRRRLLRYVRSLAIAGACLAVFASSAFAGGGRTHPVLSHHASVTHGGIVYRAGDTPGDRAPVPATHATIANRPGDAAFSRAPGTAIPPMSEPGVTRTFVKDDSGRTLAIILAGSALAIALSGTALGVVRLNRHPVGLH
jgi:hypothetical protein